MDIDGVVNELLDRAAVAGQAVVRLEGDAPVPELRSAIRSAARERGMSIRTAMLDDVLAVVRADAPLWTESTATMRDELAAPSTPNIVR